MKLIGGAAAAAVALAVLFAVLSGPGKVTERPYTMRDGNSHVYTGLYTGDWDRKNEQPNGTSIFALDEKGRTYEGEWVDGVAEGQGTMTWEDGSHYEGEWKDGTRNGQGTYTSADGNGFVYDALRTLCSAVNPALSPGIYHDKMQV